MIPPVGPWVPVEVELLPESEDESPVEVASAPDAVEVGVATAVEE